MGNGTVFDMTNHLIQDIQDLDTYISSEVPPEEKDY